MNLVKSQYGVAVELPSGDLLPIGHIIGVGRNYVEHAAEQGAEPPKRPMIFTKNPASAILDQDDIVIPKICQDREQVDFEGELALVIGKPCRDISETEAADPASGFILGYCCANDVSARWWQKEGAGGQFNRGKSFDTFCPVGSPVPASNHDPTELEVITRVNGEVRQHGFARDMAFSIPHIVSYVSAVMTLEPGDLIATGTPEGIGPLAAGDVVEIEIPGVGSVQNPVRGTNPV